MAAPPTGVPAAPVPEPVEPPPSAWLLGLEGAEDGEDLIGVGADLEPGTLLMAYRRGLFPMGLGRRGARPMGWWSPDPRGILPLEGLVVSRSLRRTRKRFEIRVDTAFAAVVAGCADPSRPGRWITPSIARAYLRLHELGWAHSIECWREERLVGGLYGVAIAGLFAGEAMFHVETDASKAALAGLVDLLRANDPPGTARSDRLLDVQWRTDHLGSLGIVEIPRSEYARRLKVALTLPTPDLRTPAVRGRGSGPAGMGPMD